MPDSEVEIDILGQVFVLWAVCLWRLIYGYGIFLEDVFRCFFSIDGHLSLDRFPWNGSHFTEVGTKKPVDGSGCLDGTVGDGGIDKSKGPIFVHEPGCTLHEVGERQRIRVPGDRPCVMRRFQGFFKEGGIAEDEIVSAGRIAPLLIGCRKFLYGSAV